MQVKRNKTLSTEIGNIKYISVIKYDIDVNDKLKESKMYDNICCALTLIRANNISNYVFPQTLNVQNLKFHKVQIRLHEASRSLQGTYRQPHRHSAN